MKPARYVLVVETSSSMSTNDDWRWMNKALQKLLRYDLDDKTEVGLVTYSHTSKIEFNMTQLAGVRQHLADILPDKYRLDKSRSETCLLCGVTNALEILGQHKQVDDLNIRNYCAI